MRNVINQLTEKILIGLKIPPLTFITWNLQPGIEVRNLIRSYGRSHISEVAHCSLKMKDKTLRKCGFLFVQIVPYCLVFLKKKKLHDFMSQIAFICA